MDSPGLSKVQRIVPGVQPAGGRPHGKPRGDADFEEQRRKALSAEESAQEPEPPPERSQGDLGTAEPMEGEAGSNLDVTA